MVHITDATFDDLIPRQDVDVTGLIVEYEAGKLDLEGEVTLFQELVNGGLAWELQGSYGRRAVELIKQGLVDDPRPNVGQ